MAQFSLAALLGAGLNGYTQGRAQVYQRGVAQQQMAMAQQKQAGELEFQKAQSDYYEGRNGAATAAAQARADALTKAAGIRAGSVQDIARGKALANFPKTIQDMYYQSPELVDAYTREYDRQNGTSFNAALFPSASGPGMPTPPAGPSLSPPAGPSLLGGTPGTSPAPGPSLLGGIAGSAPAPSATYGGLGGDPSASGPGAPPALPPNGPGIPLPGGPGASPLLFTGRGTGNAPVAAPTSLMPPGQLPGAPTQMGSPPASPLVNPLRQNPLVTARINALTAGANGKTSKTNQDFLNSVGLLSPTLQPQATALFNKTNGTSFPVPGTPTGGTQPLNFGMSPGLVPQVNAGVKSLAELYGISNPTLTKPALVPSYSPNALQTATINSKNAEATSLGDNYGLKVSQFKNLQSYQAATLKAQQQEIALKNRGMDAQIAHQRVMEDVARQNANSRGIGGSGANGATAGDALTMKLNQRLTALTYSKPDMLGNPGMPLVTLDANGNPSGPGAHEFHQIQGMLRARQGGVGSTSGGDGTVIVRGRHTSRAEIQAELASRRSR